MRQPGNLWFALIVRALADGDDERRNPLRLHDRASEPDGVSSRMAHRHACELGWGCIPPSRTAYPFFAGKLLLQPLDAGIDLVPFCFKSLRLEPVVQAG